MALRHHLMDEDWGSDDEHEGSNQCREVRISCGWHCNCTRMVPLHGFTLLPSPHLPHLPSTPS